MDKSWKHRRAGPYWDRHHQTSSSLPFPPGIGCRCHRRTYLRGAFARVKYHTHQFLSSTIHACLHPTYILPQTLPAVGGAGDWGSGNERTPSLPVSPESIPRVPSSPIVTPSLLVSPDWEGYGAAKFSAQGAI